MSEVSRNLTEMPFAERVRGLNLPLEKIIVIGSGVLDQLGIRSADDVDLVANSELYEEMVSGLNGWQRRQRDGQIFFVDEAGESELWRDWPYGEARLDYDELLEETVLIDGVRFTSLDFVYDWKLWRGREKDLEDVKLIDEYLIGGRG